MLNIGHRGAKGYFPENTLLSINKAIELGADWVEIDVRWLDGEIIVFHDAHVDRTTHGSGLLQNYSFEELRRLDAGSGESIPTLKEVIQEIDGRVGLVIELKSLTVAKPVAELLKQFSDNDWKNKKLLVSSFNMSALRWVFEISPNIQLGVLVKQNIETGFDWAAKLKAHSLHVSLTVISREIVNKAHFLGLKVYVYTVNEPNDIKLMQDMGVDGVFCDYPDRVKRV